MPFSWASFLASGLANTLPPAATWGGEGEIGWGGAGGVEAGGGGGGGGGGVAAAGGAAGF